MVYHNRISAVTVRTQTHPTADGFSRVVHAFFTVLSDKLWFNRTYHSLCRTGLQGKNCFKIIFDGYVAILRRFAEYSQILRFTVKKIVFRNFGLSPDLGAVGQYFVFATLFVYVSQTKPSNQFITELQMSFGCALCLAVPTVTKVHRQHVISVIKHIGNVETAKIHAMRHSIRYRVQQIIQRAHTIIGKNGVK